MENKITILKASDKLNSGTENYQLEKSFSEREASSNPYDISLNFINQKKSTSRKNLHDSEAINNQIIAYENLNQSNYVPSKSLEKFI